MLSSAQMMKIERGDFSLEQLAAAAADADTWREAAVVVGGLLSSDAEIAEIDERAAIGISLAMRSSKARDGHTDRMARLGELLMGGTHQREIARDARRPRGDARHTAMAQRRHFARQRAIALILLG